jgi:hypothetical protein
MPRRSFGWIVGGAFALSCAAAACSGTDDATATSGNGGSMPTSTSASTTAGAGGGNGAPTYHDDVAPILANHCNNCHHTGGIAPFPLDTYEDAAAVAGLVKKATEARTMPPFPADNSGACHTFQDARWLSDSELATLAAWVDGGAPRGDATKPVPGPPDLVGLAKVGATLDMGFDYTPPTTTPDDYRCFLVDPKLASTKYLTGFDVKPGDPRVVHHVVVFVVADDNAVEQANLLDAADPAPGWACFGGVGDNVNAALSVAWAPGVPATHFPKGTGLELAAGRKVVLQMHYNVEKGTYPDRTKVDLELVDSVDHVAHIEPLVDFNLALPPKLADATSSFNTIVDQKRTVYGVFPHQHLLGKSMRLTHLAGDQESCALDLPKWDFNWQLFYFYHKPLELLPGDQLKLDCHYDTTGKNTPTGWGEGTSDEMCVTLLYETFDGPTCDHCGPQLEGNPWPPTNLCKGSDALFEAFSACACDKSCASACATNVCVGNYPTDECQACLDASCGAETKSCRDDHNSLH